MDIFDIGPYEFQCTLEDFILQHFEAILSKYSKHLCDLTRPQLCRLLSSDKLLVTSERLVLFFIIFLSFFTLFSIYYPIFNDWYTYLIISCLFFLTHFGRFEL